MGKRKDKKKDKKRRKDAKPKKKKPSLASQADKYDLYQRSVQEPECEVEFFDKAYRRYNKRRPKVLREDFCGTFAVSCEWVKKRGRSAVCVDIDPEPLAWGRDHNLAELDNGARDRLTVGERDVRTVADEKADVLAAQNFSYWIFRTREDLRAYFEVARQNLAEDGVMVVDLMGGPECFEEGHVDDRKLKGFRYHWELDRYDPISCVARHLIHYSFKDGSRLDNAFEYIWRIWSIPEIRELFHEAGFAHTTVYWETEDDEGDGSGEWDPAEEGSCDPSWIAYIVAHNAAQSG